MHVDKMEPVELRRHTFGHTLLSLGSMFGFVLCPTYICSGWNRIQQCQPKRRMVVYAKDGDGGRLVIDILVYKQKMFIIFLPVRLKHKLQLTPREKQ